MSGAAAAQDDARTRFARGQRAYQQGDYETAISEWQAAYGEDPRPLMQYNLSQAYERLGRLGEALAALDRYLETADPDDQNQADARARRAALRERLGRTGVRITGGPDGATILIDGRDWGRTPRPDPIGVEPGSHRVVLRLEGYEDFTAAVSVPGGQSVDIAVEMERERAQAPATATSAPRVEASAADRAQALSREQPRAEASPEPGGSLLAYLVIGGGGAVAATGAVLGILALGAAERAPSSASAEATRARSLALVADVSMGVGLAAIATGVVLLLTGGGDSAGSQDESEAAVRLAPSLSPTHVGASATLMF